jgi:hypothetical protein
MATRKRGGTSGELIVYALLNDLGFDVYQPLVDDRGLDGVIRMKTTNSQTIYVDFQVKSAKAGNPWAGVVQERIATQDQSYVCLFLRRVGANVSTFYLTRDQIQAVGSRTKHNNPVIPVPLQRLLSEHQSLDSLYQRLLNDEGTETVDVVNKVVLRE